MPTRIALFVVGIVIAAATLYAALHPWQRLDSVTTEREFPEPSLKVTATIPGVSVARRPSTEPRGVTLPQAMVVSGLALSKQTRTEKTLSDPTLAALFIFAGSLIAAAFFLNNLDEWQVAGAKFKKRDREVIKEKAAAETIAAAQEEGRVSGDTVSLTTAKDLAVESADLAMQAQAVIAERRPWQRRIRGRAESQGYVSAAYLDQVVRQVQAEHRAAHRQPNDEDDGQEK